MAGRVFDNVANWSTYQDRQLAVLSSLEKSFSISLEMSRMIKDNLSSMQSAMTSMIQSANSLTKYVSDLSYSRSGGGKKTSNAKAAREAADLMRKNLEDIHRIEMQHQQEIYERAMENLEEQLKLTREELDQTQKNKKTQQELEESSKEFFDKMKNEAIKLMRQLGEMANNYLTASNNLIQISGSSGSTVQNFRNYVVDDVIGQLNRETGSVYSPQKSYEKLVSIASEAAGGNLTSLSEMARPLLIASEAMDVNLSDLAKTLNRLYNRYSFSSVEMEDLMNDIRGNTAGNSATAQATIDNITKLQNFISLYAEGDTQKMKDMMSSVSTYTSHLESQGVNTETLTEYMTSLVTGDGHTSSSLVSILEAAGSSTKEAQELLRNDVDGYRKVAELLVKGIENRIDEYGGKDGVFFGGDVWSGYTQLDKTLVDLYTAIKSPNWKDVSEFELTTSKTPAVEVIADKFVSWSDKISHWLENIANDIANIQNFLGISLTDILSGAAIFAGLTKGASILKGILGVKTGAGALGTAATAGGAGIGLGTMAAGAGAVTAGVAVVSGVSDILDSQNEADWQKREDKQASGAIKLGGVGLGAAIGSLAGPVGTLVGAGIGGLATLIFGDSWASAITDALDGTAQIKKSMEEMAAAQKAVAESTQLNQSFEELEKVYREQKKSLDKLTPGSAQYEEQLKDLETTVHKLQKTFPGYIELEEDGVSIKEASMKATEKMLEAEKALARMRADSAIYSAIDTEDELDSQLDKSINEAKKHDGKLDVITQLNAAMTDLLKYSGTTDQEMADFFDQAADGKLTGDALTAYEAFETVTPDAVNVLGLNYGKGADNPESLLYNLLNEGGIAYLDTVMSDINTTNQKVAEKQLAYDQKYIDSVNLIEQSLGMSLTDAAANYKSLSPADKSNFEKQLVLLESLNNHYDKLSGGIMVDVGALGKSAGLPGYAIGTNYIDRDQVAYLHEGEAVVPKRYNPAANMNELEVLREQAKHMREERGKDASESSEYMKLSVEVLQEIREFLALWKDDTERKEAINTAKSKYNIPLKYLTGYLKA